MNGRSSSRLAHIAQLLGASRQGDTCRVSPCLTSSEYPLASRPVALSANSNEARQHGNASVGVDGQPGLRVCVVGAGMNGLVATRECLDKGLRPTCFEREDGLGGLWRFTEHESHSSVYRSTHINSPKDWNTFADFPHEKDTPRSMPREHVQRYIEQYVEEKQLTQHIQLSAAVRSISPRDKDEATGKWSWTVTVERAGGEVITEDFDAVMICTGHHSKPNMPEFPGANEFEGEMLHSHAYKDNRRFAGKRVVTIGIGNSSSDITTEISKVAAETFCVCRSGAWVQLNGFGEWHS